MHNILVTLRDIERWLQWTTTAHCVSRDHWVTDVTWQSVAVLVRIPLWTKIKKIVFCAYLRQKWIDLRQTKTKMITCSFYTCIVEYISPAKMFRFGDNL